MALPSTLDDFRKDAFWSEFFQECGGKAFEWYASWNDMEPVFRKVIRKGSHVLDIGCGNSDMCFSLPLLGCSKVVSIDYCEDVVKEMQAKLEERRGRRRTVVDDGNGGGGGGGGGAVEDDECEMQVLCKNMLDTGFESGSFDVVLDKAALDALAAEDTEEVARDVTRLFQEVSRVLRPEVGAVYQILTLAEKHIFRKLICHFGSDSSDNISDGSASGSGASSSNSSSCAWKCVIRSVEPVGGSKLLPFLVTLTRAAHDDPKRGQVKLLLPLTKMVLPLNASSSTINVLQDKMDEARANYNESNRRKHEEKAKAKLVVLEIKPWDDETAPLDLKKAVRSVQVDGVEWTKAKTREGEYGVQTVAMLCKVRDSDVDFAAVISELEELELVQSADEVPFDAAEWE